MERATEYHPTRVSHPVETLVEFLAMYPGVPINEPFWRKRIDDYVASVVVPPVMRSLPSDGEIWSAIRTLLIQGGAIYQDFKNKPFEEYSVRLDEAARERIEWLKTRLINARQ
jgi:hypothetical protein